ncbi:MAG: FxsA family protein [Gammaproteobacteria bacterium]|nr:FxsA family protein [Gammaproteobacteria bacterium]
MKKVNGIEVSEDIKEKLETSALSSREAEKLKHFAFTAVFYIACLLVAVPDIVTDILGILLVIPFISNYVIKSQTNKAFKNLTASYE